MNRSFQKYCCAGNVKKVATNVTENDIIVKKKYLCGFSMETENMLENSRRKLDKKNLDMIVANNLKDKGAGFGVDTNLITIITRDRELQLELMSKQDAANCI